MKNFASRASVRKKAAKYFTIVSGLFQNEEERRNAIASYWRIYECELDGNQSYDGDSQVFAPAVHDAVEAITKHQTAQIFPPVGNLIGCTAEGGDTPYETISLMKHYVRRDGLRSLVPEHIRRGKIEGHWHLLVDWERRERSVRKLIQEPDEEDATRMVTKAGREEYRDDGPTTEILPDADVVVWPVTCRRIKDAEGVAIVRRYDSTVWDAHAEAYGYVKSQVDQMAARKDTKDTNKKRAMNAGVKAKGSQFMIYVVWAAFDFGDGKGKQPAEIHIGGPDIILGVYQNRYWSGRCPVISAPAKIIPGSFKGESEIKAVAKYQYQLNDVINMGMDSAHYALLPITMVDPQKNPNYGNLVLALGAVWETDPHSTQFAKFPEIWQDAFMQAQQIKGEIMQSMGVNDMMLGVLPKGRRNAQQMAAQQMAAMTEITDDVLMYVDAILNPLLEWYFELDQQYRDADLWIKIDGEQGRQAKLQMIPPSEFTVRYQFEWLGLHEAIGAQRAQQMIALMNVIRGIPESQLDGRTIDVTPIIEFASGAVFGPELAPRVIIDNRHKLSMSPEQENELLHNNIVAHTHPMDNDIEHLRIHQEAARATGDPEMAFRVHMMDHMQQLARKAHAAAPQPHGQPGIPGAAGQPGVAGTPRPGAMPAQQRPAQQPAGAIPQHHMVDVRAGGA